MYSLIVISLSITARLFNQKHKIPRKGNNFSRISIANCRQNSHSNCTNNRNATNFRLFCGCLRQCDIRQIAWHAVAPWLCVMADSVVVFSPPGCI